MLVHQLCTAVAAAVAFTVEAAAGVPSASPPVEVLETRHQLPASNRDVMRDLRELLAPAIRRSDTPQTYSTNATLDLSWSNADLFSYGILSVSCVTCYVKGHAKATLTVEPDFNVTTALETLAGDVATEIANITETAWNTFKDWLEFIAKNLTSDAFDDGVDCVEFWDDTGCHSIDFNAYAFPELPIDFDMDLSSIPEVKVEMVLDAFELYLELDLVLDASHTWTIPLYPTTPAFQPAGIKIDGQEVGIVIKLDLILAFDAEVSVSTGVHVQFDDGLSVELALFGSNVSTINLSPGNFEFLPVTVSTSGFTMDATLRLGVEIGLDVNSTSLSVPGLVEIDVGAGTKVEVYADIAHFNTNITPSDTSIVLKSRADTSYASECALPIIETYEFGLGAQAGAYVAFLNNTWGPTPETFVQIFYTTLFSACAISTAAATGTSTSPLATTATEAKRTEPARRDDAVGALTMGTATSVYTVTNRVCQSPNLANCPASLQSTVQTTKTATHTELVAAGVAVTFPATTAASVSPKAFGTAVRSVKASSGSPVSYVPPPPPSTAGGEATATSAGGVAGAVGSAIGAAEDSYEGLSESDKKLVIGLTAGLGGALSIGLVALALCCIRRRRDKNGQREKGSGDVAQPFLASGPAVKWDPDSNVKGPQVHERELLDQPTAYDSPREPGQARF